MSARRTYAPGTRPVLVRPARAGELGPAAIAQGATHVALFANGVRWPVLRYGRRGPGYFGVRWHAWRDNAPPSAPGPHWESADTVRALAAKLQAAVDAGAFGPGQTGPNVRVARMFRGADAL